MNNWFTSDCHFNHGNIIKYCNRPFKSLEEMNNTIIKNWNERVKPNDTVYHIGDFCFKNSPGGKEGEGGREPAQYWENKLNGKIIHIGGNHDRNNSTKTIIRSMVIKYGGKLMYLVHDPKYFNIKYPINLVGHVHEKWLIKERKRGKCKTILLNVGVDQWDFRPISLSDIQKCIYRFKRYKKGG